MKKVISLNNLSRTQNSIINFTTSVGGQILTVLLQFIVRTVFINTLGKSYLGINGLFSNILSMLSLAEFGVGNAIIFKLYEPVAQHDRNRILVLLKFYKTVYKVIGIVVLVIGICLIPALPYLIKNYDSLAELNINAVFVFCLYLLQSVTSYFFFAYKQAILLANQQQYAITLTRYVRTLVSSAVQIICLLVAKNFELYVIILLLGVIADNLSCAWIANRMHPYITETVSDSLPRTEIKEIAKDCAALVLYRLNGVVLKFTDNIIISATLGLEAVGLYSNYYIFYTTIGTFFEKAFSSVAHSIGNLHTEHDLKQDFLVFKVLCFVANILGGTAFVGIALVSNELVTAWIGPEWLLGRSFALLLGFEIYTLSIRYALSKYRNALGLFQQAKYRPLFGMAINLVVSVVLAKRIGLNGVILGTIVADWTTMMWYDPLVIYKHGFSNKYPVIKYYLKKLLSIAVCLVVLVIDYFICSNVFVGHGWLTVIVHALICGVTVPSALMLVMWKTEEGLYLRNKLSKYPRKLLSKLSK